jgi:hypothetical protein
MQKTQSLKIVSVEGETSFCYHEDSGCLFDCGEGASLFLKEHLKEIRYIFLSDFRPEHTGGIRAMIEKCDKIEIFYPEIYAYEFNMFELDIGDKKNVVWTQLKETDVHYVDKNDSFIEVTLSRYLGHLSFSYKMCKYIQRLKPALQTKTHVEIAALKKSGVPVTYSVADTILLYSVGALVKEMDAKGCKTWVCGGSGHFNLNKRVSLTARRTIYTHFPLSTFWPYVRPAQADQFIVPPILISNKYG